MKALSRNEKPFKVPTRKAATTLCCPFCLSVWQVGTAPFGHTPHTHTQIQLPPSWLGNGFFPVLTKNCVSRKILYAGNSSAGGGLGRRGAEEVEAAKGGGKVEAVKKGRQIQRRGRRSSIVEEDERRRGSKGGEEDREGGEMAIAA